MSSPRCPCASRSSAHSRPSAQWTWSTCSSLSPVATLETIPFGRPMIGEEERAAVAEVLAGSTLTHGPRVKDFEAGFADFTGAPHAIATATCMAALHLSYLAIDLGPGDEVIVAAQ